MNIQKTGLFIKKKRKELNYSQQKLAELLEVEPQTISKWERGLGMPDYNNVDKLKEIFNCSLTDILEPDIAETESIEAVTEQPQQECPTTSTALVAILQEGENEEDKKKWNKGIFSKKKINEKISKMFGVQYENVYKNKFLFKGVFRKRTKEDFEDTISQGMYKGTNHTVLGLTAPWLYLRVFGFLLLAAGLGLMVSYLTFSPIFAIIFCGLVSVIPLVLFLFESNISREISIFTIMKIFIVGGMTSIIFTFLIGVISDNEAINTILLAPLTEEFAKFTIAMIFISKLKPKSMLSGLLIGFTVGAGFDVFESFMYAMNAYTDTISLGVVEGLIINDVTMEEISNMALNEAISTITTRTGWSFFSGHHFFTAVPCAIYMLIKKSKNFNFRDFFNWKVVVALVFSMCLHAGWNASTFIPYPVLMIVVDVIISVICVATIIFLINLGIAHERAISIINDAKDLDQFVEGAY